MNVQICKNCPKYWHLIYSHIYDNIGGMVCSDNEFGKLNRIYKGMQIPMRTIIQLARINSSNELKRERYGLFNHFILKTKNTNEEIEKDMSEIKPEDYQCQYFIEHELSEMNK